MADYLKLVFTIALFMGLGAMLGDRLAESWGHRPAGAVAGALGFIYVGFVAGGEGRRRLSDADPSPTHDDPADKPSG